MPFAFLVLLVPAASALWPVSALSGGPCGIGPLPGDTLASYGFESGADGFTTVSTVGRPNLWHTTTFSGNGTDDVTGHDGPGRWYYGVENAQGGTYNTSRMRNQGEIRSPAFTVPAGRVAIAMSTKWHVEWDRPAIIDSMQVGYADGAGNRNLLCTVGNQWAGYSNLVMGYGYYQNSPSGSVILTACEYSLESPQNPCRLTQDRAGLDTNFDLAPITTMWESRWVLLPSSLAGQTVRASFYFQTGDAIVDDAMGWMVDDVRIVQLN